VTSPSRLLPIVSTDFLALRWFCFNMRQHGRQILHFKLHVDGRKFRYRRPHAAVRLQVVHHCPRDIRSCPRVNGKKHNLEQSFTETASSLMHSLIDNFEAYFPRQQATDLQSNLCILKIFGEQHPPEHLGTNLQNHLCHQPFISRT